MKKRQLPPGVYFDPKSGRFIAKQRLSGKMTRAVTFSTVAECVEHNTAVREAHFALEAPPKPKGLTLGAWLDTWLKRREESGRHRDVANDRKVLDRYVGPDLRETPLRDLRQRDARSWLYDLAHREAKTGGGKGKGKNLDRQTVANALNLVRASLAEAVDAGKIHSNPCDGLRPPKGAATTKEHTGFLTAKEIETLLTVEGLPLRLRTIYVVAIHTGMRASELWGLRWENIVLDGPRPEVIVRFSRNAPTKGGRVRRVPLLPAAREALAAWRASLDATPIAGIVWPTLKPGKGGDLCHAKGYDGEWGRWGRGKAKIPHPFKQLRHTCGCHLAMGTWGQPAPMEVIQRWLGHQSITTTERFYARYAPDYLHRHREALECSADSSAEASGRKAKTHEPS